jgi:hypothetical protein
VDNINDEKAGLFDKKDNDSYTFEGMDQKHPPSSPCKKKTQTKGCGNTKYSKMTKEACEEERIWKSLSLTVENQLKKANGTMTDFSVLNKLITEIFSLPNPASFNMISPMSKFTGNLLKKWINAWFGDINDDLLRQRGKTPSSSVPSLDNSPNSRGTLVSFLSAPWVTIFELFVDPHIKVRIDQDYLYLFDEDFGLGIGHLSSSRTNRSSLGIPLNSLTQNGLLKLFYLNGNGTKIFRNQKKNHFGCFVTSENSNTTLVDGFNSSSSSSFLPSSSSTSSSIPYNHGTNNINQEFLTLEDCIYDLNLKFNWSTVVAHLFLGLISGIKNTDQFGRRLIYDCILTIIRSLTPSRILLSNTNQIDDTTEHLHKSLTNVSHYFWLRTLYYELLELEEITWYRAEPFLCCIIQNCSCSRYDGGCKKQEKETSCCILCHQLCGKWQHVPTKTNFYEHSMRKKEKEEEEGEEEAEEEGERRDESNLLSALGDGKIGFLPNLIPTMANKRSSHTKNWWKCHITHKDRMNTNDKHPSSPFLENEEKIENNYQHIEDEQLAFWKSVPVAETTTTITTKTKTKTTTTQIKHKRSNSPPIEPLWVREYKCTQ